METEPHHSCAKSDQRQAVDVIQNVCTRAFHSAQAIDKEIKLR